jgi:hypothetical protein
VAFITSAGETVNSSLAFPTDWRALEKQFDIAPGALISVKRLLAAMNFPLTASALLSYIGRDKTLFYRTLFPPDHRCNYQ